MERTQRTEKLIGVEGMRKLRQAHVLLVGAGGVGGCVFEMLARSGVGRITVADGDAFEESNLNRQLLATVQNIGVNKARAAAARAKEIAPDCEVIALAMHYNEQTADDVFAARYAYVADCIDSVADKTSLIVRSIEECVPVISAMGSGNRLSARFEVKDIYATAGDGLARAMRKRLRAAGVQRLNVVCDTGVAEPAAGSPGTVSYVPNLSGCVMAQKIITDLLWNE